MRNQRGFSLLEVTMGLAVMTIVTSVGYGVLIKQQKEKKNIERLRDMYSVKNEMQLAIGDSTRCLTLVNGARIPPARFNSITDTVPITFNRNIAARILGWNDRFGNVIRPFNGEVRLFGLDGGGLRVLRNVNGKSTVRALLGLEMSTQSVALGSAAGPRKTLGNHRSDSVYFTHKIPITLLINNSDGVIDTCQSSPYGSSPVQDLCTSLGADYRYDIVTKQCLVPMYNCCNNNAACERALLTGPRTARAPCNWVSLQDALCDLEERGRVPSAPHCVK